jgi:hypothetical protein
MRIVIITAAVLFSTVAFSQMRPAVPEGGVLAGVFGVQPQGTLIDGPLTPEQAERFKHRCKYAIDLLTFETVKSPKGCIENWRNPGQ